MAVADSFGVGTSGERVCVDEWSRERDKNSGAGYYFVVVKVLRELPAEKKLECSIKSPS